jgi:large subunit ribosomal protein L17
MRHRKANIKLGRTASHRDAMLRNMATSLLEHGNIKTTVAKAKAVKPVIDRLVTLAKRGDLHSRRKAAALITKPKVLRHLFDTSNENYASRVSGFVQMARIGPRAGDAAPMVIMKLIVDQQYQRASTGSTRSKSQDRSARVAASRKGLVKPGEAKPDLAVDFSSVDLTKDSQAPMEPEAAAAQLETASESVEVSQPEPSSEPTPDGPDGGKEPGS